tara:strand:+ start:198 stop:1262 length:1065 start_codon:yes stop_codon:yes gene_type:complete
MKYRFIDLFCGLGGFRLGFEKNGFECVFSSDFDKNIQDTYEKNFNERPFGDITKVNPSEIPDFEVLTAGFPCQPFSISGKKRGFEDTRGTLFFDVCRIIKEKHPKVVLLENVKHFIHHDKKRTMSTVLSSLENLGYNISFKILNLKDFGLPQNRERIFIVASKNGCFDFDLVRNTPSKELRHFLDKEGDFEYLTNEEFTLIDPEKVTTQPSGLKFVGYRNKKGFRKGIRPNTEHLNRVHRQPNRIYSVEGYHPTIPSQESAGRFFIYFPESNKVRKLTINECFRIMGFKDTYKKISSKGMLYRQIGNSVGINVIDELSKQIINQGLLLESKRKTTSNPQKVINKQTQFAFRNNE